MQEIIRNLGAPHEARPHRDSRLVIAAPPVLTEVDLPSPMRIEIVGEGAAESLSHVRYLERNRIVEVTEGRGDAAARMQPLISHKYVVFWIRVALRVRGTRDK